MNVVFHIGYSKTATTWFQKYYFPKVVNSSYVLLRDANRIFLNTDFFVFDSQKARKDLIAISKNKNLLVSSEHFTTAISFGRHYGYISAGIANKIHATFPEAHIVVFLRRQQSLICSAYQQYIKNGGTFGFKRWFYSGDVFNKEHLIFDKLISYYDGLFGKSNVHVYLFEEFRENQVEFLKKMNEELGFEVDFEKISFAKVNRGIRKGLFFLLKIMNYFYNKPLGTKRCIIHIPGMIHIERAVYKYLNPYRFFGSFLSEKDFLSRKDIENIKQFYSRSNTILSKRIDAEKLRRFGYFLEDGQ